MQVEELTEDLDITSADGQQMALQLKNLEKLINQTARKSQILFMETGLEVEKSKVTVEQLVEQLVVNLTRYEKDLRENTKDVDNLYKDFHNLNPTKDCKCSDLNAAVTRLERGVANVTQLANQNRLELEENSEVGGAPWGGVSDWEPAVEVLQAALEQVRSFRGSGSDHRTAGNNSHYFQLSLHYFYQQCSVCFNTSPVRLFINFGPVAVNAS